MKFLVIALFIFTICFSSSIGQETTKLTTNDETSTNAPTTEVTSQRPTTVETTSQETEAPTTNDETTHRKTTHEDTTTQTTAETSAPTTAQTTVITSTVTSPPTTTAAPVVPVLSFRLPKNESEPACFRANTSLAFDFKYVSVLNDTRSNSSINLVVADYDSYSGFCNSTATVNTLTVNFRDSWTLTLTYILDKQSYYELNSVELNYTVDNLTFPNAADDQIGPKSVVAANLTEFSANKGNSYKCFSNTSIPLNNNVQLDVSNYQAQPFLDPKTPGFDTAVECPADTTGTSKLVPIIVGSALAVLVVLVLIAYIIGRRKHRPGYQQV